MTFGKYLTGGAVAAIAAALALAATPAPAREARENMGRSWQPSSNSAKASERREARSVNRSQPVRQAPQRQPAAQRQQWSPPARPAPQVRQAPPQVRGPLRQDTGVARRDWPRGNDRSNRDARAGTTWNRGNAATPPAIRSVPVPSRNTTYADGGRNRSYTDSDRNRSYGGRHDDNARADRRSDDRSGRWADRRDDRWSDRQQERRTDWRGDRRGDRYAYNGGRRDGYRDHDGDHLRWDSRGWRNDHRYNWRDYRNSHRTVFRLGGYYAPYRNYSYRRLSIGFYLDSLFYADRYWINDPWNYRLPAVYGPYRWVRYYDDALLVDIYSGEVVDTIYDFFW
ncbi:RcnB family protein [Croceibacterium aestuarii]|uniref:RcnB family protein n=1 Tax=Croceibacterium aestuarii TaxID=3064139 RepID=UPI00272EB50F|nr:RcnB family protein [Croceibacterium sp. D39]